MARILYGVQGDGRGHLSRSLAVAGMLTEHEYLFVGGGPVAEVADKGYAYEALPMIAHKARNSRVDIPATLLSWGETLMRFPATFKRLDQIIRHFDPHLIITDYEFFTPRAARKTGRECISLDHQHVITNTVHQPPCGQPCNRLLTEACIRAVVAPACRYLISSFHKPPVANPQRDEIFGTVLQPDALNITSVMGEHAVVYIRHADPDRLAALLGGRKREYRVYGFGSRPELGNVRFMPSSREGFLNDLGSSAYILSNGGHGLLSEALYLGKPVFSVPTYLFFEQYWNAWHVGVLGYGRWHPSLNFPPELLDAFEKDLDFFRTRILAQDFCGRTALQARLNQLLETV